LAKLKESAMPIRLALCAAALTMVLAPTAVSAQVAVENLSMSNNYRLLQVSLPAASISPADFKAQTQAIQSCGDARKLARDLGARLTRSTYVGTTNVPRQLLPVLAETPTGRATPVLVDNSNGLHVLVVCSRT
jgi:hypothetical protein